MTKRNKAVVEADAGKRPPDEREKKAGEAAATRVVEAREEREKTRSSFPRLMWRRGVCSEHSDENGFSAQLTDALGLVEPRAASFLLNSAINAGFSPHAPTDQASRDALAMGVENALSFVAEVQPKSAVESALAVQMAAAHSAAMTLARYVARTDDREALADANRMMNQTMRTFTAQAEALHKLRTGGKQQVEVRYVYVDARTQTVVNAGGGDGGALPFAEQPHAPRAIGHAPAPGLPVWSPDEERVAVPVASDQGEAAVPDARGQEPRCASGTGERELHLRAVDGGGKGKAGRAPRAAAKLEGNAA